MISQLKKIQSIQLEIAKEFIRICDKFNLQYFLVGGSLLGAVRHKGFIPWDDDLDLGMLRDDYKKFIKCCNNELNQKFYLHCHVTDSKYWLPFAKLKKKNTFFDENAIKNLQTNKGIYIDIFPLDYVGDTNELKVKIQAKCIKYLGTVILLKRGINLPNASKLRYKLLHIIFKPFSIKILAKIQEKIMSISNKTKPTYLVSFGSHYGYKKETMPIDKYFPLTELEFGDIKFNVPKDYDFVLSKLFGDYMTLPPIELRGGHHCIEVKFNID